MVTTSCREGNTPGDLSGDIPVDKTEGGPGCEPRGVSWGVPRGGLGDWLIFKLAFAPGDWASEVKEIKIILFLFVH